MKKYYEDAKYNAAFDRCVDVMTQLLLKYGPQVLEELDQDASQGAEYSMEKQESQPIIDLAA